MRHLSVVPALHHARALERRSRVAAAADNDPRAHGCADSRCDQRPETGAAFGGRRAPVLRHRGQGGQLPGRGHRGPVDRRARVDARRRVVAARGMADARGPAAGTDPRGAAVSGEVAAGARVAAAGASQRRAGHGGAGGRGIRGQRDAASVSPPRRAPLRPRDLLALTVCREAGPSALAVRAIGEHLPRTAWRVVTWRNGTNRPWKAQFAARRVTPAQRWPHRRRAPAVWLLCEGISAPPRVPVLLRGAARHRVAARPGAAGASTVGHRAAYQELKDELGLDHFEGRSFVGWHRHDRLAYRGCNTNVDAPARDCRPCRSLAR